MPFGLCNAAQRLMRLMDKVIPQELKSNVFVYLDDLLVMTSDFDTHLKYLEKVARCLKEANLTIGLKKSHFCFEEVTYLGYIVGKGCLRTNPEKVSAISRITPPNSIRQLRSFLGTVGWYRRFIKDFSSIAAPLTEALKKTKDKFQLGKEALQSFEALKSALTKAPVLVNPDYKKPFFVQCDASDYGIGAVLFQKNSEGEERPIAFFSQKLNSAQKNYFISEKECLAAVMAVKRFRPYIELHPFTLITDHASLQWLMSMKDLSGRLARWALTLQSYNFQIEHVKGSENVVADTLSRLIEEITVTTQFNVLDAITEAIDDEYTDLIEEIKRSEETLTDLKVEGQVVYRRIRASEDREWKIWVPRVLTQDLIRQAHEPPEISHGGIAKTLERLRRFYYWPKMAIQVRQFVSGCRACKEAKPTNKVERPMMGEIAISERPFQKLYIDFLGKYPKSKSGNTVIFIVLDHMSKYVVLKAMPDANAGRMCKFLRKEVFHKFGVPEVIHSDNGKQFKSNTFNDLLKTYQVKHVKNAFYAPQANAAERVNQSILAAIRTYLEQDHRDWDLYLSETECALRSSVHTATGVSPYFALFGQHMFLSGNDYRVARKIKSIDDPEFEPISRSDKLVLIRDKIKSKLNEAQLKYVKHYNKK